MTDPRYIGTILYVGLAIFAALLAAGLLMQERRWSVQRTALLWGAEGLILLLDLYLCFGLLPAPLRLPVSLTVGFLSYSAVFIAVSADGFWKRSICSSRFSACAASPGPAAFTCAIFFCPTARWRSNTLCAPRSILSWRCRSCWPTGDTAGRCSARSAAFGSRAGNS